MRIGARTYAGGALLDPAFGRTGFFKGERSMGVLRELIGDCGIEDLPMPFTAVATDLASGVEVWLRESKLFDANRALIATPLIFTPFKDGDRTLLDAALVPSLAKARQSPSASYVFPMFLRVPSQGTSESSWRVSVRLY